MAFPALVLQLLLLIAGVAGGRTNSLSQFLHQPSDDVGTRWAVLVAGTKGWGNYRHQADVCHAYQVLKNGRLKDENIIVFMYDDIADSPDNPSPGVIINNPNGGGNVYDGVPHDYTGKDVTVNNFLAVLLGNKSAITGGSGKVVRGRPKDHIFVFYSNIGGEGVLDMPSETLFANDLVATLKMMHAARAYKSLVFYLESSNAESIFGTLLPPDINVYATAATNLTEINNATYCPGQQGIPPGYDICLGDLYSVSWMEDTERSDRATESLLQQYDAVQNRTAPYSHVKQYGDDGLSVEKLEMFMGVVTTLKKPSSAISQRDASLLYLWQKYQKSADGSSEKIKARKQLTEELARRSRVDSIVEMIAGRLFNAGVRLAGKPLVDDWDCLKSMVRIFEDKCGALGPYGMKHTMAFANMCNAGVGAEAMSKLASQACSTSGGRSF